MQTQIQKAISAVTSIIDGIFDLDINAKNNCLIISDEDDDLSLLLKNAYVSTLPNAKYLKFDKEKKEQYIEEFNSLPRGSLVVLIQTTSFRLDDFRIRLHLFNAGLMVVEHLHLSRNSPQMYDTYINSLVYDKPYYLKSRDELVSKLEQSNTLEYIRADAKLIVTGDLEKVAPNVGDYSAMQNKGGTFPIGEVFTESKDLRNVNGSFYVDMMAGSDFTMLTFEPFLVVIKQGEVITWGDNAPDIFVDSVKMIQNDERAIIRELGFGLNKNISKQHPLGDVTAYERNYGFHFSLGEKHSVYKKAGISSSKAKYHIDLFPVIDSVKINGESFWQNGRYFCHDKDFSVIGKHHQSLFKWLKNVMQNIN